MSLMRNIFINKKNCRLCNSKKISKIFNFLRIPISEKYYSKKSFNEPTKVPITLYFCKKCKNVQTQEVINPKLLWKEYTYFSGQTKAIVEHFNKFSEETIKKFKLENKDYILDIGSNDGSLLCQFKKKGYKNVIGVDPAKKIVEEANKKKIKTYHSFFDKKFSKKLIKVKIFPKIITAFNVFAHSDKMIEFVKSIKDLLRKDGIFIFEVQYLKDILDKEIIGTFFHEHMNHYSVIALENFFNNNGLFLFDIQNVKIQKGSIIGYACHKNFMRLKSLRLKKIIKKEKKYELDKFKSLIKIQKIVDKNKAISTKIINQSFDKKLICGYGAARSGALLAINYGLEKKIQYIFDDHKMKVNKFSEINKSKVINTNQISVIKPDLCIILAYLHNKNIIKKNLHHIKKGIKFMSLYPKPIIIDKKNFKNFL